MASSESQSAEVECFSDEADTEPIDLPGCEENLLVGVDEFLTPVL